MNNIKDKVFKRGPQLWKTAFKKFEEMLKKSLRKNFIFCIGSTLDIASSWYISLQQNFFLDFFRIFKYASNYWLDIYKIGLRSRFLVVYREWHCEIILFLFKWIGKNKKHGDHSSRINIGYSVLYLKKPFTRRKFSVVLSCLITKYVRWNVLRKKSCCKAHLPSIFSFLTFHP